MFKTLEAYINGRLDSDRQTDTHTHCELQTQPAKRIWLGENSA